MRETYIYSVATDGLHKYDGQLKCLKIDGGGDSSICAQTFHITYVIHNAQE